MNMATRMSRKELLAAQKHRRNCTRLALAKDKMGSDYLLHPENTGVRWGIKSHVNS